MPLDEHEYVQFFVNLKRNKRTLRTPINPEIRNSFSYTRNEISERFGTTTNPI